VGDKGKARVWSAEVSRKVTDKTAWRHLWADMQTASNIEMQNLIWIDFVCEREDVSAIEAFFKRMEWAAGRYLLGNDNANR
jgi:hypothetical protein